MILLKSVCIAISTYSVIPMPRCLWLQNNLRYAIVALPVVGLFIGAMLLLWQWLWAYLALGNLLFAVVAALLPIFISGGIHADGFCDTVDALASNKPREIKLQILKDPHSGAFALIYLIAYILLTVGLYTELAENGPVPVIALGFVLSRALTALTALILPNARNGGMLSTITKHAAKSTGICISMVITLLTVVLMLLCNWLAAIGALLLAVISLLIYSRVCLKNFGGITGDTSGFFLQICELAILAGAIGGQIARGRLLW